MGITAISDAQPSYYVCAPLEETEKNRVSDFEEYKQFIDSHNDTKNKLPNAVSASIYDYEDEFIKEIKLEYINSIVEKELERKNYGMSISNNIKNLISDFTETIVKMNYNRIAFEQPDEHSILFTFLFEKTKVRLFYDSDLNPNEQTIFSIVSDGKIIMNGVGNIQNVLSEIQEFDKKSYLISLA